MLVYQRVYFIQNLSVYQHASEYCVIWFPCNPLPPDRVNESDQILLDPTEKGGNDQNP